ncbi:AzlD domain-containing protein [Pusillimonas sp. MFBS29]|uniref:AzlD family protein n=1 Tax=Pusillimonas sp. MFBS29 TaxID=2886690 RepID=UPI001D1030F0|nr:AzlD domain-containing protein [Pusillimonas sp. MFBS29]MCC2595574.1 AzlD domain-containing protein [Pusillimonas sp. MFBS29]
MNLDTTGTGALFIVLIMAIVTLATRWGGVYVMGFVPISKRVKRFIQAMSGSVLVAIVTPMAVTGDVGAQLSLLATGIVMLSLKRPLLALACGIVVAALVRLF